MPLLDIRLWLLIDEALVQLLIFFIYSTQSQFLIINFLVSLVLYKFAIFLDKLYDRSPPWIFSIYFLNFFSGFSLEVD